MERDCVILKKKDEVIKILEEESILLAGIPYDDVAVAAGRIVKLFEDFRKRKMLKKITVKWNKGRYEAHCSRIGKYSCFGIGDTPEEALKSLLVEIPIFEKYLDNR